MAAEGLHVETEGPAGAPGIVLAHGFGGSARNFRPQVRALRPRYRVAAYDARGHARSAAPSDPAAYDEAALAADFASVAADVAPGPAAVVAGGLSMGAAVALAFARRQASARRQEETAGPRVRGLVLASYPAGPRARGGISSRALAFAEALEQEGLDAAGERFVWGPGSGMNARDAALVRQGFLEHDPRGLALTLRHFLARLPEPEALAPGLADLRIPTLLVVGEHDTPAHPACRALADALPDARLEIVPGAGHVVNLVAPKAFNALLGTFLEEIAEKGA